MRVLRRFFLTFSTFPTFSTFLTLVTLALWWSMAQAHQLDTQTPGTWYQVPSSTLRAVAYPWPPQPNPGGHGVAALMDAWSGAAYDTTRNRLIVWGGGHGDYPGNEIYVFDVPTLAWELIAGAGAGPSLNWGGVEASGVYPDGLPRSRHTYNYIQYIPSLDALCSLGIGPTYPDAQPGASSSMVQCFGFTTGLWSLQPTRIVTGSVGVTGASSAMDAAGNAWLHTTIAQEGLYKWTVATDTWAKRANAYAQYSYGLTAALDTTRNQLVALGSGEFYVHDLDVVGTIPTQTPAMTGPSTLKNAQAPGFVYDPVGDQFIGWTGGTALWRLDPVTWIVTAITLDVSNAVTPTNPDVTGTYGRFRYLATYHALIVVNSVDQNVYLYKIDSTPLPPDTEAPTTPTTVDATATSPTAVTITWGLSTDNVAVTGYDVQRDAGTPVLVAGPPYLDTGLTANTLYTYGVRARDAASNLSAYATDTVTTPASTTLPVGALTHDGPATPEQLSLFIPVTGSLPQTATATVRYKATSSGTWLTGHPLYRLQTSYSETPPTRVIPDAFAWPIIDLLPGTSYDVEVTVSSAGVDNIKTATFVTRALPASAGATTTTIAAGASAATVQAVFNAMNPGAVIQFADGTYTGNFEIRRGGTPAQPITIRGTSRGGTIIAGATVDAPIHFLTGGDIILENLSIQGVSGSYGVAFHDGAPDQPRVTIRNVTMTGGSRGVVANHNISEFLMYDCTLIGPNIWTPALINSSATWNHDGINVAGFGNAVFNVTITGFGDSLSYATHSGSFSASTSTGVHFYRNEIRNSGDDLTEVDYGHRNITFYDNRSHNSMTALSLDPLYGGPLVYARNIAINVGRTPFKWNSTNGGQFVYNNTIVSTTKKYLAVDNNPAGEAGWWQPNNGAQRAYGYRNNLLVYRGAGTQTIRLDNSGGHDPVDFDHNSWYPNLIFQWPQGQYANLAAAYAALTATTPVFSGLTKRHEQDTITVSNPWTDTITLGSDYQTEVTQTYLPTLSVGTTPKNTGIVIPNITDGYSGALPDRGAVIEGRAAVVYGDRSGIPPPPPDTLAPSIPQALTATGVSSSTISLAWLASTDNVGITGYAVLRNNVYIATAPGLTYLDTGLVPGTAYAYTVVALDAVYNYSAPADSATGTTLPLTSNAPARIRVRMVPDVTAPSVPTGLTANGVSSSQVDLAWNASTDNVGVVGYRIYRNAVLVTSVATLTYSDTGLTPSTAYTYTIAAYDAVNNVSAQTAGVVGTTLP